MRIAQSTYLDLNYFTGELRIFNIDPGTVPVPPAAHGLFVDGMQLIEPPLAQNRDLSDAVYLAHRLVDG